MESLLNVGAFLSISHVNGPGNRTVIWLQGCQKNCRGCYNQDFRKNQIATLYSGESLYEMIMAVRGEIEGVTFSGGEPFDQAQSLYALATLLKQQGLHIMCYSGYTLSELNAAADPYKKKLLDLLDILVDGPYMEDIKIYSDWRSSKNQTVYYFSGESASGNFSGCEQIELIIDEAGNLIVTGNFADDSITKQTRGYFMSEKNISLKILGGGQEIGANCYLLEWGQYRIVLDSGLDPRKAGYEALPALDLLKQQEIDAIIISHAHADHIGSLPFLAVNYLKDTGKVFMTQPNLDLIPHMLKENVKFVERGRIPKNEQYFYHEFFDRQLIDRFRSRNGIFRTIDFNEKFEIIPNVLYAKFFPAGHILGAAGMVISDGQYTFVYTGDVSFKNTVIQPGCIFPKLDKVNCLLIESTHGSQEVSNKVNDEEARLRLAREISNTIARGGHVLIPAFALGRTQEMVIMLAMMKKDKLIPNDVPVYYHYGITEGVNQIYDHHSDMLMNLQDNKISLCCEGKNAYQGNGAKTLRQLSNKPSIFLFTSGMMNRGTPAAMVASRLIKSEKHGIFFCGYVAPNELGYELVNVKPGQSVCIDKEKQLWVEVVCPHIYQFSFSGHASRNDLLNLADYFNPDLTVWIHGDKTSTEWLAHNYGAKHPAAVSITPQNRDTILLQAGNRIINKQLKSIRAVLITVGTSLLTTYAAKRHSTGVANKLPTEEEIQSYILQNIQNLQSLCAETNSISRKGLNPSDILYFICSDNPEGRMCGSILKKLYEGSHICNIIEIDGLRPDTASFHKKGMKNLLARIVELIEDHGGNAMIHATGGFKAQIAIATMVGILMKCDVYYLHQDFDDLVRLPDIPLNFDYQSILANKEHFFTLMDGRRYWAMDEIFQKLPDSLKACFLKDDVQKKYNLSPVGRGIFDSFERHMGRQSVQIPIIVTGESSLWGTELDSFGKILNPVIGIIMERLNWYADLIQNFEFSSKPVDNVNRAKSMKDNYLELVKKGPNQLVYLIHHAAVRKGIQDILTIKTIAGTAEFLLDMVGRKIYP